MSYRARSANGSTGSASSGKLFRVAPTMTFEMPDGRDLVVNHFDLTEPDPGEEDPPPERRFAPYA
jgi:hypothetical protein